MYGQGQARLRDDHAGAAYKYDVYKEDPPFGDVVKEKPAAEDALRDAPRCQEVVKENPPVNGASEGEPIPEWALEAMR